MRNLPTYPLYQIRRWALVALATGATFSAHHGANAQPPGDGPPPASPVRVEQARRDIIRDEVRLTGTVIPMRYAQVSTAIDGRVDEVLVDAGDFVRRGDPMIRLRSRPTELELAEARAHVDEQQAALDELLNGTRPEDLAVARAEVDSARANARLARSEEQRYQQLLQENAISQSEYDRVMAESERAEAELAREEAHLERLTAGEREEVIRAMRTRLEAGKARVQYLEDELELHTIRAPFDAMVGEKNTEAGEWVRRADTVFRIAEIATLRVEVAVPESHFNRLAEGTPVRLTFDALDGETREATVTTRIPLGNAASRTFPVRIELKNDKLDIAPGMLARVVFEPEATGNANALLVPKDAIVRTAAGAESVWTVDDGETGLVANSVTVRTGRTYRDRIEILEGDVSEGARVVVRGNEVLRPFQPVRIENGDIAPNHTARANGNGGPARGGS